MIIDIDAKAVVVFTNKLEKISKSALPVAVRQTLNDCAFDVKKNTMPRSATNFINRTANFFKANSRVEMARGFNIGTMEAVIGFTSDHLRIKATNYAVKDLEQQEYSGTIHSKEFIPLESARINQNHNRVVSAQNRLTNILKKQIYSSVYSNISGKGKVQSDKAKFVAAVKAAGVGGLVLGNKTKTILWRVKSITGNKYKLEPLYSVKLHRSVHVGETGFMRFASLQSANKLEDFYVKNAERQLEKYYK